MNSITDILDHILYVCKRNKDGSLDLGTYEVALLDRARTYAVEASVMIASVKRIVEQSFPHHNL